MPDNEQEKQSRQDPDLLEQLLVVAAEKAAKHEAEDALRKGFVTRQEINLALDAFGAKLQESLADQIVASLDGVVENKLKKAMEEEDGPLAKAGRKSTIITPEEEREADPVTYLLRKGRTQGPDSYDDIDKRLLWAMTQTVLAQGMIADQESE